MRILLIEDEAPAARRLAGLVRELRPVAELLGPCDTTTAAGEVLAAADIAGRPVELLLCDIELADGLSFRLWEQAEVTCPVIFVTAYDQYAVQAFRVNSLDYLLKPVRREELGAALDRFDAPAARAATAPKPAVSPALIAQVLAATEARRPSYRQRVLTTQGQALVPLPVADVAHFYSEDRLSFAVPRDGGRPQLIAEPIGRLAEELDPAEWFQINRAQLVHVAAVQRAEPYLNHRLKLRLRPPSPAAGDAARGRDVVARERVRGFRVWLWGGA